jgi:hypothetical protein
MAGLNRMSPQPGPGQELAADRGVGLQGLVVGLGEAIVLHGANRALDRAPGQGQAELARHPGGHGGFVGRLAVHIFRKHPDAAAGGHGQGLGDRSLGEFGSDIHGRIAHADDDDVLAPHVDGIERVAIGVAVKGRALELAGIFGDARAPMVAVAHEQDVVEPCFTSGKRHLPQAVGIATRGLDGGVEGDGLAQTEVIHIVLEVLEQLSVVRKVRPVGGDREILEGEAPFGGVDVQAGVAGLHAVGIVEVPVAADLIGLLEAVIGNPEILQPLGGRESRATRADDAGLGQFRHIEIP